jgi:amino acid efflux transporter
VTDASGDRLDRVLTLGPAVGLAVTMVVGSGLLVLPGLVFRNAGDVALLSWVVAALIVAPVLLAIASLGASYPSAGGIAGFVRPTLGDRWARSAELVFLGSIPGGGGLALVGGNLLADLIGPEWLVPAGALAVLALGWAANRAGARLGARLQQVLSLTFVIGLGAISIAALAAGGPGPGVTIPDDPGLAVGQLGLVFFAFAGWELMAFTSEEFVNPRRDFPLMVGLSFVAVTFLYLVLAAAIQTALSATDPDLETAPISALADVAFGDAGRALITVLGLVIVAANVNGVVWAFSRLTYSAAREGTLPGSLTRTDARNVPDRAVTAVVLGFAAFVLIERLGWIELETLFRLAAACIFAGLVLAAAAFVAHTHGWRRVFAVLTLLITVVTFVSFGLIALYPIGLAALGWSLRPNGGRSSEGAVS